MIKAIVKMNPGEDLRIRQGHPWVYDNEISSLSGEPEAGDEVKVLDARGSTLGYGFFNPNSKIRVRIFSKTIAHADSAFFRKAFSEALAHRAKYFDVEKQSLRVIFGEADFVPGLVVDRFIGKAIAGEGSWLSAQFLSYGVERRKGEILDALEEVFAPQGIVERSDAPVRALEGLDSSVGIVRGTMPESILMEESGTKFLIDLAFGQKTGWFLDQRANRAAAIRYARGKRVLDVFCNQGGFGILCGLAGAGEIIGVDGSTEALAAATRNAAVNGLADRYKTVEADAFDYLRGLEKAGDCFDMIILDPPAFAKSRSAVDAAHRGYKEINMRAMRLLQKGGILLTCSCSFWFDDWRFDRMLAEAANDSSLRFRTLYEGLQDLDHPIVSGYSESRYLKCRILEIL
jgi:23S rRNA (cytosine1962-C5)-methyltransferase